MGGKQTVRYEHGGPSPLKLLAFYGTIRARGDVRNSYASLVLRSLATVHPVGTAHSGICDYRITEAGKWMAEADPSPLSYPGRNAA